MSQSCFGFMFLICNVCTFLIHTCKDTKVFSADKKTSLEISDIPCIHLLITVLVSCWLEAFG
jgi:hypothetical protein